MVLNQLLFSCNVFMLHGCLGYKRAPEWWSRFRFINLSHVFYNNLLPPLSTARENSIFWKRFCSVISKELNIYFILILRLANGFRMRTFMKGQIKNWFCWVKWAIDGFSCTWEWNKSRFDQLLYKTNLEKCKLCALKKCCVKKNP